VVVVIVVVEGSMSKKLPTGPPYLADTSTALVFRAAIASARAAAPLMPMST